MRIAICDDDPLELKKIKCIVEDFTQSKQTEYEFAIDAFASGDELLRSIKKHSCYDLMILDVIMPGMNGIELAGEIREICDSSKIIFLTSSPDFAMDSYKVKAFYYLLKTSYDQELPALLGRALDAIGNENSSSVIVKEKGKITRVWLHTIEYVESINHTIYFHLHNGSVIDCLSSLTEFQEILLADRRFIKCHKSFLVNMYFVASITTKDFVLAMGTHIPISRNVHQQVKRAYFDYFFENGKELVP